MAASALNSEWGDYVQNFEEQLVEVFFNKNSFYFKFYDDRIMKNNIF